MWFIRCGAERCFGFDTPVFGSWSTPAPCRCGSAAEDPPAHRCSHTCKLPLPFPQGRGPPTTSPARRPRWGYKSLCRKQRHALSADVIKRAHTGLPSKRSGGCSQERSFMGTSGTTALVLQSTAVGTRSVELARGIRVCGHTQGGMQGFGLQNCHSVTAVPTQCVAGSANLSIALQKRHSLPAVPIERKRVRCGQRLADRRGKGLEGLPLLSCCAWTAAGRVQGRCQFR